MNIRTLYGLCGNIHGDTKFRIFEDGLCIDEDVDYLELADEYMDKPFKYFELKEFNGESFDSVNVLF